MGRGRWCVVDRQKYPVGPTPPPPKRNSLYGMYIKSRGLETWHSQGILGKPETCFFSQFFFLESVSRLLLRITRDRISPSARICPRKSAQPFSRVWREK